jgi:8-oxo-dGTP pyrophosphatase MutT (NUDIX family)
MTKTRYTARVILINPENKILLMQAHKPTAFDANKPAPKEYWFTPGGEMESNETPEQAAMRELYEETGITDAQFLVPHIAYQEVQLVFHNEPTLFKEYFFIARSKDSTISTENFTEAEKAMINNYRWWSLEELKNTRETFFPVNLVELIEKVKGENFHEL